MRMHAHVARETTSSPYIVRNKATLIMYAVWALRCLTCVGLVSLVSVRPVPFLRSRRLQNQRRTCTFLQKHTGVLACDPPQATFSP